MKKGKGKAAKKAMNFAERIAKAEKWVAEYDGTLYGGDIIKAYRKKFVVDRMKAVAELRKCLKIWRFTGPAGVVFCFFGLPLRCMGCFVR